MLGRKEMKELALRRQELVIQSQLNRLALRAELQNVETALEPARRLIASAEAVRPWMMLLAPLAGIVASRGLHSTGGIISKAVGLLKWIKPLTALWKRFNKSSGPAETQQP